MKLIFILDAEKIGNIFLKVVPWVCIICITRYCVVVSNYSSWWKRKDCWCIRTWHFSYINLQFFCQSLHLPWVADVKNGPLESLETILGMLLCNLRLFLSTVPYCYTRFLRNWSWLIFFSEFKWWNNGSKRIRLISCVQYYFLPPIYGRRLFKNHSADTHHSYEHYIYK